MSSLPFEEPTGGPSPETPMPGDGGDDAFDLGPRPPGLATERPELPPAEPPAGMTAETAQLLQALATYEREELEKVMRAHIESAIAGLDRKFDSIILDPQAVLRNGIFMGVGVVLVAIVVLIAFGFLFLYGVSVFTDR